MGPDVWLYQFIDKDLAAELTAKRTKYYANDELNCLDFAGLRISKGYGDVYSLSHGARRCGAL